MTITAQQYNSDRLKLIAVLAVCATVLILGWFARDVLTNRYTMTQSPNSGVYMVDQLTGETYYQFGDEIEKARRIN